jgi:glycerol kinase
MKAGVYPKQDEFAQKWALDRRFEPAMPDDVRGEKYAAWKRAVKGAMVY